ncbi:MAG: hypothetical protein ACM3JB_11795 [Acidobacteriaceae bacterium]
MQNASSVEERATLQGWIPELAAEDEIRDALEKAFDYRGDITITKKDGAVVEGYIFDRKSGKTLVDSLVRVLPKDSNQRQSIPYCDIAALVFSGRDTAAGKSWEAWVRKYWEKRARGETYNLTPDTQE